jgi:hypothetical protein
MWVGDYWCHRREDDLFKSKVHRRETALEVVDDSREPIPPEVSGNKETFTKGGLREEGGRKPLVAVHWPPLCPYLFPAAFFQTIYLTSRAPLPTTSSTHWAKWSNGSVVRWSPTIAVWNLRPELGGSTRAGGNDSAHPENGSGDG